MDTNDYIAQLVDVGIPVKDAETVVDCFITADNYGVTSHGMAIFQSHLNKIINNGYNPTPDLEILRETSSFAIIDGDNGMGPVVADYCMNYAVKKSRESGIFTVLSPNNNTFGPAFYYPLKAAEKGVIGFICSNSPAQMPPMGGIEKMLGTNPFSVVIPVKDSEPIIIDMATSVVAKSKFKEYKSQGKSLPMGWALDELGNPTTDPDEGMRGSVLPMAGFKGYSIAMLIDILAGALSGAAFLNNVGRFYSPENTPMNVGFYIVAIDPYIVFGDKWDDVIAGYVRELRESKPADGKEILLPGDDRIKFKNR